MLVRGYCDPAVSMVTVKNLKNQLQILMYPKVVINCCYIIALVAVEKGCTR